MLVVVDVQRMDKTRNGHILALHRGINAVLQGFFGHQTVHGLVGLHLDAGSVSHLWLLFGRFIAHDFRV